MVASVKRTDMADVIYFERALSMHKGAPKGPPPQLTFASYAIGLQARILLTYLFSVHLRIFSLTLANAKQLSGLFFLFWNGCY